MSGDVHVQFSERLRVKSPWSTQPYIKVKGKWKYLYRAIDERGNTIDFYLSHRRNAIAAKRFLKKLIKGNPTCYISILNTDKNPAYGQAINELKREGKLAAHVSHSQIKFRNTRLEADHGKLKRLINPVRGFQSMKTAYATIKGFEIMRMFKKGSSIGGCMETAMKPLLLMSCLDYIAELCLKFRF